MSKFNTKTQNCRWLIFLILLSSIMYFLMCFAQADAEVKKKYGYNLYPLNVRAEMDIDSEWIEQYPGTSTIIILEDLGDWYKVENGYVMKQYVYDSVDIYTYGKILNEAPIYSNTEGWCEIIGFVQKDAEYTFIKKVNGYLELLDGGFVEEKFVTFSYTIEGEIKENTLTVEDMQKWNMANLPIQYLGTLKERTAGSGVTTKSKLYFKDIIPIYDIINGEAYFPSGQNIFKISLDKFSEIENVGKSYNVLAAYRTIYYSSSSSRKHNIALVSSFLDGCIINANSTFSYNKTTGPRSASKGYEMAPVISNGQYVDGYGGGVCQVSSTIYAAIMNHRNFEVTARREHGLPVSYLPTDMDATVSYGSIDLKFINRNPFAVQLNVKSENGVCLVTITRIN